MTGFRPFRIFEFEESVEIVNHVFFEHFVGLVENECFGSRGMKIVGLRLSLPRKPADGRAAITATEYFR